MGIIFDPLCCAALSINSPDIIIDSLFASNNFLPDLIAAYVGLRADVPEIPESTQSTLLSDDIIS